MPRPLVIKTLANYVDSNQRATATLVMPKDCSCSSWGVEHRFVTTAGMAIPVDMKRSAFVVVMYMKPFPRRDIWLSGANPRHVVMLTETAQIFIQLFDSLLVCLDTLAFQSVL